MTNVESGFWRCDMCGYVECSDEIVQFDQCGECGGAFATITEAELVAARAHLRASMERRGWHIEGTGGGCEAWANQPDNNAAGFYWLITEADDPSLPATPWTPVALGLYGPDMQPIVFFPAVKDCLTAAMLADSANIEGV